MTQNPLNQAHCTNQADMIHTLQERVADLETKNKKERRNDISGQRENRTTLAKQHRSFRDQYQQSTTYLIMPTGVAGAPITCVPVTPRLCRSMFASQPLSGERQIPSSV
jgi:hypothetical protein